jgi:hypothetical protein
MKGCTESCAVYRYRERGESEKSVANRRFAGKLYGRCPQHGRFGGDAGDDKTQEYIETNSKKLTAESAGDRQPAPAKSPAKVASTQNVIPPARSPATPLAKAANGGWGWPWE